MYFLTIVFLVSQVSIVSPHATLEACEQAARRARAFDAGTQAVASARCAPAAMPTPPQRARTPMKKRPRGAVFEGSNGISRGDDGP